MAKLSNENKLILVGLLGIAVGTATLVAVDPGPPTEVVVVGDGGVAAPTVDAAMKMKRPPLDIAAYNAAVKQVREKDPTMVDLLTGEVEPGAEVATEVTIPAGGRADEVSPVGPAQGMFEVLETTYVDNPDGTVVHVRARNTGTEAERFIAMFHWTVPGNPE